MNSARVPCCVHCSSPDLCGHAIPCPRCRRETDYALVMPWLHERADAYAFLARFAPDDDPDRED